MDRIRLLCRTASPWFGFGEMPSHNPERQNPTRRSTKLEPSRQRHVLDGVQTDCRTDGRRRLPRRMARREVPLVDRRPDPLHALSTAVVQARSASTSAHPFWLRRAISGDDPLLPRPRMLEGHGWDRTWEARLRHACRLALGLARPLIRPAGRTRTPRATFPNAGPGEACAARAISRIEGRQSASSSSSQQRYTRKPCTFCRASGCSRRLLISPARGCRCRPRLSRRRLRLRPPPSRSTADF